MNSSLMLSVLHLTFLLSPNILDDKCLKLFCRTSGTGGDPVNEN